MACKDETATIDGMEVYCIQWPAETALEMKFRLVEMFGPSLGEIGRIIGDEENEEEIDVASVIGGIVDKMFSHSSPKKIVRLIMDVVNSANIDGTRMNDAAFNDKFSGNLKASYRVFFFVLKVNYSDFFEGSLAKGVLGKIQEKGKGLT